MKELGHAIDESLTVSEPIQDVVRRIKDEGYDVLLLLEATLGYKRRGTEVLRTDAAAEIESTDLDSTLTPQDQQFLRSMMISLEE